MATEEQVVFDAIADPVRRAILRSVAGGPRRVVDIADEHPISRPAISRHLRVLVEAGLVDVEERGRERHYRLRRAPLRFVGQFLSEVDARSTRPLTEAHLAALGTEVWRVRRERIADTPAAATRSQSVERLNTAVQQPFPSSQDTA